jgi:TRAP-type C4-dicarboxylate transport system permease small subunit
LKVLELLARLSAIAAGAILALVTLLTCATIIGRETIGATVPGDFELVALATGAVVGLFMPLCQLHRNNIVIDFFTVRMPKKVNSGLDRMGAFLLSITFFLLSWRAGLGGYDSWSNHSTTMLLGFPEWIAYLTMVPSFFLTAVIALYQTLFGFGRFGTHHQAEHAA